MSANGIPVPLLRRNRSSLALKTETGREREALRHLHSWIELYKPAYIRRNAFPPEHPMPAPAACHDTALAAFAQLAALRLGARRAFITIISTSTEYVLVEATKTMSLQSDFVADPKDESWLGTSSFARSEGLNDLSLDEWRKARRLRDMPTDDQHYYTQGISAHWHIINDMKHTAAVQTRAFFQRASSPRFYFAIPLRGVEGTVIGSLSILDDTPRYGVSAHDMSFCEDLGDTIALHLQSSMIRSQRQRSERLIQALGIFNSGGLSLRSWWSRQDNAGTSRGGRHLDRQSNDEEVNARFDAEFGFEKPQSTSAETRSKQYRKVPRSSGEGNLQAAMERAQQGILSTDFSPHNPSRSSVVAGDNTGAADSFPSNDPQTSAEPFRKFDLTNAVNQSYGRASKLLREALGATGVAFVDASHISTAANAARRSSSTPSDDNTGTATGTSTDTETSDGGATRSSKMCTVTGISTYMETDDESAAPFELSRRDLSTLIKAYPRAKVFSFMRNGDAYSGSEASGPGSSSDSSHDAATSRVKTQHSRNARILRHVVGKGGSIMFYPIFDDKSERWRSALFVWTKASNVSRFFDQNEDVTYCSAFAHSLRADLARIETAASDAAKGTFISSISHEFRCVYHIMALTQIHEEKVANSLQYVQHFPRFTARHRPYCGSVFPGSF